MKLSFPVRIYIMALLMRLIPIILARGLGIGLDDMFQYDMLARSIVSGNGYRWYAQTDLNQLDSYVNFDLSTAKDYDPARGLYTSFRAPLYPTFLALVYFFSGTDFSRFFAARLAQAIFLGAPLAPLTYLVSLQLFPVFEMQEARRRTDCPIGRVELARAETTARFAAWIVAAYPMLIIYPMGLGTENPFFLLTLVSFFFILRAVQRPAYSDFLLGGLFLGFTALTRSVILPFAGAAILYLIYLYRRPAILTLVSFSLVVGPWVIRNSLLHHKLTGIETSMGYNLYLGYYPAGNGSFIFGPSLDLLSILDDVERDRIGTQKAIEFIRSQPERFLPLAMNRLGFFFGLEKRVLMYFYSNNLIGHIPRPLLLAISAILLLPFVFLSTSAALGLSLVTLKREHILLALLFLCYLLPHVFILSEDRFHLVLIPYFAILAAFFRPYGFGALAVRWRESGLGKTTVALAVLAIFFLFLNWGLELFRDADKIAQLLGPNGNTTYFPY